MKKVYLIIVAFLVVLMFGSCVTVFAAPSPEASTYAPTTTVSTSQKTKYQRTTRPVIINGETQTEGVTSEIESDQSLVSPDTSAESSLWWIVGVGFFVLTSVCIGWVTKLNQKAYVETSKSESI